MVSGYSKASLSFAEYLPFPFHCWLQMMQYPLNSLKSFNWFWWAFRTLPPPTLSVGRWWLLWVIREEELIKLFYFWNSFISSIGISHLCTFKRWRLFEIYWSFIQTLLPIVITSNCTIYHIYIVFLCIMFTAKV